MPYCSQCGYEYQSGIVTCPDCGVALKHGTRHLCEACGEEFDPRTHFCTSCGVVLPAGAAASPALMCEVHKAERAKGRCVVCHRALCAGCVRVRNGRMFCDNDDHVKAAFNWVVACTTSTEQEAEMIKANLEGAGIGVFVLPQRDRMYVTTVGDLAVVEVMVPMESLQEARAYIQSLDAGEPPAASES